MKSKNIGLLILMLGLTSGTILVDRFIIDIPDGLAIIFIVIAIASFAAFLITNKVHKK